MANTTQKQNQSLLGLSPLSNFGGTDLAPYSSTREPANHEEGRILDLFRKHELIIDLTAEKARIGMSAQAAIQQHASDLFGPTISYMLQNKDALHGTEAYPYVEEFTLRQIRLLGQSLLSTAELSSQNIALIVHKTLNLPPEQRGFLDKLFGLK